MKIIGKTGSNLLVEISSLELQEMTTLGKQRPPLSSFKIGCVLEVNDIFEKAHTILCLHHHALSAAKTLQHVAQEFASNFDDPIEAEKGQP